MGSIMSQGASRDLWVQFAEARDKAHSKGFKKRPNFGGGGDGMEMQSLRMEEGRVAGPPWMDRVDSVKSTIADLHRNLKQLGDAQVEQLKGVSFDFEAEGRRRDEVDDMNKHIGKLFSRANTMVKQLTDPGVGTNDDLRVRKNIQMGLAGELQTLSSQFRKKHKEFLKHLSERRSNAGNSQFNFTPPADTDDADDDVA